MPWCRTILAASFALTACRAKRADSAAPPALVEALRATESLPRDPDDPAIWVNRSDPSRSLVLGTMKVAAPDGALAVFGLDGRLRHLVTGPDRPNNVDVDYGLDVGGTSTDIAVLTERLGRRLRVYAIAADGSGVQDISAGRLPILEGVAGDAGAPMGIGLYRRPKDGALFAIVAPKAGPKEDYLWQYRLQDDGTGHVKATFARRFGAFGGVGEIEAVAVDDELGYVYYADEDTGIHKYHADPDVADANRELALFGTTGYERDREGLGIYALPGGKGYIVSVDQRPDESVFHVYRREGEPGRPHDHSKVLLSFKGGADGTDGLDVSSAALGPEFPDGIMVAMNSAGRNFLLFRWRDIAAAARPSLAASAP
ncbi:MAG: 3-phytase [Acidobacteria bacterium]|nr:MAG: 3-phytase [Acidobacteriota bacterium]